MHETIPAAEEESRLCQERQALPPSRPSLQTTPGSLISSHFHGRGKQTPHPGKHTNSVLSCGKAALKLFLNSQGLLIYIKSKVQAPGCCQLAWLYQMASMETHRFTAAVDLNRNAVVVTNKIVEAGPRNWRGFLSPPPPSHHRPCIMWACC